MGAHSARASKYEDASVETNAIINEPVLVPPIRGLGGALLLLMELWRRISQPI